MVPFLRSRPLLLSLQVGTTFKIPPLQSQGCVRVKVRVSVEVGRPFPLYPVGVNGRMDCGYFHEEFPRNLCRR